MEKRSNYKMKVLSSVSCLLESLCWEKLWRPVKSKSIVVSKKLVQTDVFLFFLQSCKLRIGDNQTSKLLLWQILYTFTIVVNNVTVGPSQTSSTSFTETVPFCIGKGLCSRRPEVTGAVIGESFIPIESMWDWEHGLMRYISDSDYMYLEMGCTDADWCSLCIR